MRSASPTAVLRAERDARRKRAAAAVRQVEPEPPARVIDRRSPAERRADEDLDGTWWRCRVHELTQDAVFVGAAVYCPDLDCTLQVLLAHSAGNTAEYGAVWRKSFTPARNCTPATGAVAEVTGAEDDVEERAGEREEVAAGSHPGSAAEPVPAPSTTPEPLAPQAPVAAQSVRGATPRVRRSSNAATKRETARLARVVVCRDRRRWTCAVCGPGSIVQWGGERLVLVEDGLRVQVCFLCALDGDEDVVAAVRLILPRGGRGD